MRRDKKSSDNPQNLDRIGRFLVPLSSVSMLPNLAANQIGPFSLISSSEDLSILAANKELFETSLGLFGSYPLCFENITEGIKYMTMFVIESDGQDIFKLSAREMWCSMFETSMKSDLTNLVTPRFLDPNSTNTNQHAENAKRALDWQPYFYEN